MTAQRGSPSATETFESIAYLYDGTLEGLLSAVFKTYEYDQQPDDIVPGERYAARLGQVDMRVETDTVHAERVRAGIIRKAGASTFTAVLRASTCDDYDMGMIVYRFIRYAMARPPSMRGHPILEERAEPAVADLLRLTTFAVNECEKMRQFVRFTHLDSGIWFARCNPAASVIPLVMGHFADRLNDQPFIIYDENHQIAGVYNGDSWQLARGRISEIPPISASERIMQAAWKRFYDSVAIEARYNPELRRQLLPRRLWKNLTEMS